MIRFRIALRAGTLLCVLFLAFNQSVAADELQDITLLYKKGEPVKALERLETYLSAKPKDAQGTKIAQARFLKGLILAEQGKTPEAVKVYVSLTEDYPELPEPYNNLAVLYAMQNQMDKARLALEMAISTHPTYATAHENLGDVYAKMASLAYDKALQLDKGNAATQTKLALVKDLFSNAGRPNRASVKTEPVKGDIAKPAATASVIAATSTKPIEPEPAKPVPVKSEQPKPEPAKPAPLKSEQPKPEPVKPAQETKSITELKPLTEAKPVSTAREKSPDTPKNTGVSDKPNNEFAVIKTLHAWTKAWSGKDVGAYLAFYAKDFKTPAGESRAAWEKSRRERISHPKSIHVTAEAVHVTLGDNSHATAVFRQIYQSNALTTSTQKSIVFAKYGDKWLIQQERVGH